LPVELAGNSGDEACRHEHRAQHQRNRDQRRADFVHALDGGLARRQAGGNVALHVLDHHDGIVDHDADRQHQPEQRKIVERETEQRHEEERADERDRNRDQRDDGGAPGLQEHDDDEHDQKNGLADGRLHLVDRLLDELGRVVDDGVLDARREPLGKLLHGGADGLRGGQRVRARPLEHRKRDRGLEVQI
jgi:hypothetical protein